MLIAMYQASFEEAITTLGLVDSKGHSWLFRSKSHEYTCIGKPHQTFPNQSFHQITLKSSTETKMGNFAKKEFEANSTQCSQAVTHPSTD